MTHDPRRSTLDLLIDRGLEVLHDIDPAGVGVRAPRDEYEQEARGIARRLLGSSRPDVAEQATRFGVYRDVFDQLLDLELTDREATAIDAALYPLLP